MCSYLGVKVDPSLEIEDIIKSMIDTLKKFDKRELIGETENFKSLKRKMVELNSPRNALLSPIRAMSETSGNQASIERISGNEG